ncbi:carbon-nitrogen hydrolase family protein [Moraxella nasovis]|uniref:nitrilase-related carbon-nitrogen hydrolase n=1 Tax=Moraxella nasovis TaxID=2904121 RepID=UPI001F62578D|nr:nitrilase-related carbon-nitrogen hydrolase [Moraxella nasovis]UNU73695.1 carbon-nitrogen hydrolase family protein [Moraxella nasovis]
MSLSIASIQLCSQTDIDANLDTIKKAVSQAANQAQLIILPENACVMGRQDKLADRFDEMVAFMGNLAKTHHIYLVAGTLPCPTRPDGTDVLGDRFRQVSLVFNPQGKQIARYDKIHLFRATVDDSTGGYDENNTFEAGDTPVVVPLNIDGQIIHLGLMICFDVRFPRLAQTLRNMGADIISMPAAFTYQTGKTHWQTLLQARALDSQCLIIGSTQGGTHHIGERTRQTWGHAMMVNANGQIIATTNNTQCTDDFAIIYADFDKAAQKSIRQTMPIFECFQEF